MSNEMAAREATTSAPGAALPRDGALAITPAGPQALEAPRTGEILPPRRKRRRVLPLVVLAGLAGAGYAGHHWFVEGRFIVSTDDAYVKADMSTLAAKVSGYVATVPIVDNAAVTKGQVLATIDDGDYRNAVEAAEARIDTQEATIARIGKQVAAQGAAIDQARAMVQSSKADVTRALAEFERADSLARSAYGTQQKLDDARADRDRAAASVANTNAAVVAAEATLDVFKAQQVEARKVRGELQTGLDKANRDLSFTVIRAPFDGVIGNKAVQPGQYVQPGTRLLALVPLETAYVEANFKETQIGRLKPGQQVLIKPDAFGDRDVIGTVESIAPASGAEFSLLPPENATGNFTKIVQRLPVRISIPPDVAREGILRPGLSVVVDVRTRPSGEPAPTIVGALGLDAVLARINAAIYGAGRVPDGSRSDLRADDRLPTPATVAEQDRKTLER